MVGAGAIAPATDPEFLTDEAQANWCLFAVDPKHRRRGHGSRLLTAVGACDGRIGRRGRGLGERAGRPDTDLSRRQWLGP